ncbi:MAG: DUF3320 domain-containing protein [Oscillospiraceae bacterium]|nr:DUF3320 domain-containing protein [Oscillospiraceae bacterium]
MNKLKFSIAIDSTLNFAMYNNDVPFIKGFSLINEGEETIENLTVKISAWPDFMEELELSLPALPPEVEVALPLSGITLKPEYLYTLSERLKGQVSFSVSGTEGVIGEEKRDLFLLAFDEWNGGRSIPEIIAAFVVPNSKAINAIIKQASVYMKEWTGSEAIDGYQSGNHNRVKQQMGAIFRAIQDMELSYVNPPASFEKEGQRIRLPEAIAAAKAGTCIDLSLLYAAALEAAGINPIIVFIEGHAFAGAWLVEESFPEGAFADYSMLTKRAAEGINEICLVEATALTKPECKLDEAIALAMKHFNEPERFQYFVDIKRARISQIRPLPLRSEFKSYTEYLENLQFTASKAAVDAPELLNKIEFIESGEAAPASKVQNWQKQLLDLSLRNNLINLRLTSSVINLLCPNIHQLEDSLFEGKEYSLLPVPAELKESLRDFDAYKSRTGTDILTDVSENEFKQGRIRTTLTEAALNKSVVDIYRKAKNSMEENGANILYLAIGTLHWYESSGSEAPRYAPLILLPLEIVKKSAGFGYVIRKRDDDPIFNYTLVEFLKTTYGIDLSSIENMPMDDSGVDVKTIFAAVNHQVMQMSRWGVEETAIISSFSFNKFVMWNDLRNHSEALQRSKVVRALVNGTADSSFEDAASGLTELESLDEALGSYDDSLLTPISADSSQLQAIYAANLGNSFVLHGPPGTGKSQTITNMIANLIGNGKTVLFVAEKLAALSVVQKRLASIGLDPFCLELHSNKSNKKDILKKLEETLNLGIYKNSEDWAITLDSVKRARTELNGYVAALHKKHGIGFSVYDAIQRLSALKNVSTPALFDSTTAYSYTAEGFNSAREYIRRLDVLGKACGSIFGNPLADIKQSEYSNTLSSRLPDLIDALNSAYTAILEAASAFEAYLGGGVRITQISLKDLNITYAISCMKMEGEAFTPELLRLSDFTAAKAALGLAQSYAQARTELLKRYDVKIEQIPISDIIAQYNISQNKGFFGKRSGKKKAFKALAAYLRLGTKLDKNNIPAELQAIDSFLVLKKQFDASSDYTASLFGRALSVEERLEPYAKNIECAEKLYSAIQCLNQPDLARAIAENAFNMLTTQGLQRDRLNSLMGGFSAAAVSLLGAVLAGHLDSLPIAEIPEKAELWRKNLGGLQNICAYNSCAAEAEQLNLLQVVSAYESGRITELAQSFDKAFYSAWLDKAALSDPVLASFTKEGHEDKINAFADLDNKYTMLARQEIFARLVAKLPRSGNVNSSSEMGLLTRAIHSGGRGVALRKLFSSIPNLLNRLAPCMLMSPISVAQYLEAGFPPFDVVIFDEASQMPTHEAVGAISRGDSLIVVGDPKQLPPTSFFSVRQTENEDDIMLNDLESVLDDCMAVNMPSQSLTWHYRSRHESLISFSNYNFYEGKLLTFPSYDDEHTQIEFFRVEGTYTRGSSRNNKAEAKAVVAAVEKLAIENPNSSIGVVSLSMAQQTLIEDLLDERFKENPQLEKYNQSVYEPIFVKNLENVQGDERDIIIFSVGYGKDEKGYMSMNFGPINKSGGWRRLNVAISRARQKLLVFASITAEDIDLSRSQVSGVAHLRGFLQYAQSNARYIPAASSPIFNDENSAIELELYNKLVQKGYTVHKNVGRSRYKIPLAVMGENGEYIMGILFDGSYYKNAKTARDRELLSNSVLKGLNWYIYQVWSQRWLANPEEELNSLLAALEKAKTEEPPSPPLSSYKASFDTLEAPEQPEKELNCYKEAILEPVPMPSEYFYTEQGGVIIAGQAAQILESEAPVSMDVICRKITSAWGIKRVSLKTSDRIMAFLEDEPHTEYGGNFFFWGRLIPEAYTSYRTPADDGSKRAVEDIPPEEIINGAKAILEEQIAMDGAALAKELAKLFGYARVTESLAEKFADILRLSLTTGHLKQDTNGKYIDIAKD